MCHSLHHCVSKATGFPGRLGEYTFSLGNAVPLLTATTCIDMRRYYFGPTWTWMSSFGSDQAFPPLLSFSDFGPRRVIAALGCLTASAGRDHGLLTVCFGLSLPRQVTPPEKQRK